MDEETFDWSGIIFFVFILLLFCSLFPRIFGIIFLVILIIIIFSYLGFVISHWNEKEHKKTQEELEIESNKKKLQTCLVKAKSEYGRFFILNSHDNFKSDYFGRKWNNKKKADIAQKKLQEDKKLCEKLYGTKQAGHITNNKNR